MEEKNMLSIPAINDINEINEEEELGLSHEDCQKIARDYTNYWKNWDGISKKIEVQEFLYQTLYNWGYPQGYKYFKSLHSLSELLKQIREKK